MYTVRAVAHTTRKDEILLAATFSITTAWVVYRTHQGEHFQANLQGAFHICMQTKSYLWWQIADCSMWLQYRWWDEQLLSTDSRGLCI